jgi:hypothetical protein
MSVKIAVSAFAHRSARRRHALELCAYSAGLVALLVLVAFWIVAQMLPAAPIAWPSSMRLAPAVPIPWSPAALADVFSLCLVGFGLLVLVPAQVAATLAAERRSGTLDQLRSTPLSPLGLLCGLVVGAPVRLYLLCLGPLLFHVGCGLCGVIPLDTLAATLVVLATGTIASTLLAAIIALAPRQETGGAFVALTVAGSLGLAGMIGFSFALDTVSVHWAFLDPAGALNAAMLAHDGLWRHLFVSAWSLDRFHDASYLDAMMLAPLGATLLALGGSVLLARAACRKLAQPHLPLFSKPQAVALFALVAASLMVPVGSDGASQFRELPLVLGLFLLPVAGALATFSTPSFEAWALALRRGRRPRSWQDDASALGATSAMALSYLALLVLKLDGFPSQLDGSQIVALGWAIAVTLCLPLFALFAATHFRTQAARAAFAVAISAHLLLQLIAIGMVNSPPFGPGEQMWIELGAAAGVLVPAWIFYRQRVLVRRTLAGA